MIIIADYILGGLGSLLGYGIKLLPQEFSSFTLADLSSELSGIQSFWVYSFSISTHYFPHALFFYLLLLIFTMEIGLFLFKIIKYAVNFLRGAGG